MTDDNSAALAVIARYFEQWHPDGDPNALPYDDDLLFVGPLMRMNSAAANRQIMNDGMKAAVWAKPLDISSQFTDGEWVVTIGTWHPATVESSIELKIMQRIRGDFIVEEWWSYDAWEFDVESIHRIKATMESYGGRGAPGL